MTTMTTLTDFRSFSKSTRASARPLEPVIDPAGWTAEALADVDSWSYRITAADVDQLRAGVIAVRTKGVALAEIVKADFPLGTFGEVLADVRRELLDGRGIVMLRGVPVDDFAREDLAIAYLGLGAHLGQMVSQNGEGHVLGHVKDIGGDYSDPNTRGYLTKAEMNFHSDSCDYVGLLCLKTSKSGGASRIASSITIYNALLERRPDLAQVLTEDFYWTKHDEVNPGEEPFYKAPMFVFHEGYLNIRGPGAFVAKAQGLPGVPLFTDLQNEAIATYRAIISEFALDIEFRPGDIQFLHNYVVLHTRRAFDDWDEPERRRHLLRLWLRDDNGRPMPQSMRDGILGHGVRLDGVPLIAPLDVAVAA